MNKAVKGEKAVRKAKVSVPVRYAAQQYQFIDLTPSAVGRGFLQTKRTLPMLTNLNNSLTLLFLHGIDFIHFCIDPHFGTIIS